jgi:hypothetical protein
MLFLGLDLCMVGEKLVISRGGGRDVNQYGDWGDDTRGIGEGLDNGAQGTKGQVGLREFLQEVLGILGDIELCPQGEESSHNCLEML